MINIIFKSLRLNSDNNWENIFRISLTHIIHVHRFFYVRTFVFLTQQSSLRACVFSLESVFPSPLMRWIEHHKSCTRSSSLLSWCAQSPSLTGPVDYWLKFDEQCLGPGRIRDWWWGRGSNCDWWPHAGWRLPDQTFCGEYSVCLIYLHIHHCCCSGFLLLWNKWK